jgi:hypothetical protein
MRSYFSFVLLAGLSAWAQSATTEQRAARVQELGRETVIRNEDDAKRLTREKAEANLAEICSIVREQVLESLNEGANAEQLLSAMQAVLGPKPYFSSGPVVYFADLNGVKTVVTGYDWGYGGPISPDVRVTIEGYRNVGFDYELAAEASPIFYETGQIFDNESLNLAQVDSPRSNEMWLLARGAVVGASAHRERMRIYSFDGYAFHKLWTSGDRYVEKPTVDLTQDSVAIESEGLAGQRYLDVLHLTDGGVVASSPVPVQPVPPPPDATLKK